MAISNSTGGRSSTDIPAASRPIAFKEKIKSKLPTRGELLPVFSIILFAVFTWSLYRMFYQVPSWLFYLSVWDVLMITAYVLGYALFESAVILGFIMLVSLILPTRIFKNKFIAQGGALSFTLALGAYLVQRKIGLLQKLGTEALLLYPVVALFLMVVFIFAASFVFERLNILNRFMQAFAERMTIFAYIYIPLGLIGLSIVVLRNLF